MKISIRALFQQFVFAFFIIILEINPYFGPGHYDIHCSTVAAGVNALAAITYMDLVLPLYMKCKGKPMSSLVATIASKGLGITKTKNCSQLIKLKSFNQQFNQGHTSIFHFQ